MTDREKVIRAIEYCLSGCSEKCPYHDSEYCYLAPDDIENKALLRDALELLKDQGWISVKDRLPHDDQKVICYHGYDEPDFAIFCNNYNRFGPAFVTPDMYEEEEIEGVTHWMPLPEPPKEET